MASAGYRKRVSPRTGRISYQVWWVADDGSQGARTVDTPDEAKDLVAEKRLELRRKAIEKWDGKAPIIGTSGIPFMDGKL